MRDRVDPVSEKRTIWLWRSFSNSGYSVFLLAGALAMGFLTTLLAYASLFQLGCFTTRNAISINGSDGNRL